MNICLLAYRCAHEHMPELRGVQRTPVGISSLLLQWGFLRLKSGHQAWWQASLPTEPAHWPLENIGCWERWVSTIVLAMVCTRTQNQRLLLIPGLDLDPVKASSYYPFMLLLLVLVMQSHWCLKADAMRLSYSSKWNCAVTRVSLFRTESRITETVRTLEKEFLSGDCPHQGLQRWKTLK